MSRGLGKVQRAVLDYLQQEGKPRSISDIAWDLNDVEPGRDGMKPWPSPALYESVRRAAKILASRGLLRCAYTDPHLRDERVSLFCWLPEHTPPEHQQRLLPGTVVEHAIIRTIEKFLEENDWFAVKEHNGVRYVRYGSITDGVWKSFARSNNDQRIRPAMSRALKRLQDRGTIKLFWFVSGRYKEKYIQLVSVVSQ